MLYRFSIQVVAGALLLWSTAAAHGQFAADRIVFGGQHYLRTQHAVFEDSSEIRRVGLRLCDENGIVAYVDFTGSAPGGDLMFFAVNRWMGRQFEPRLVDSALGHPGEFEYASVDGYCWFVWSDYSAINAIRARVFDSAGLPVSDTFLVTSDVSDFESISIIGGFGRVLVVISNGFGPSSTLSTEIFMRAYTSAGQPLSDLLPFCRTQNSPPVQHLAPIGEMRPDGSVLTAFARVGTSGQPIPYLSSIQPDLSVGGELAIGQWSGGPRNMKTLSDRSIRIMTVQSMTYPQTILRCFTLSAEGGSATLAYETILERLTYSELNAAGISLLRHRFPDGARLSLFDSTGAKLSSEVVATIPTQNPGRGNTSGLQWSVQGNIWLPWDDTTPDGVVSGCYITILHLLPPGDLNADGSFNNFDIEPFVLALIDREAYHVAYPDVPLDVIDFLGDMNGDGVLNNFDIDPFVEALVGAP